MKKNLKFNFCFIFLVFCFSVANVSAKGKQKASSENDRQVWVDILYKMAKPVLYYMSEGKLHANMSLEVSPAWRGTKDVAYLECFGRLMNGLAPWLSLPDDNTAEGLKRKQLRQWALKSYANAVNPQSPDYVLWRKEKQPLVDAAFLAQSFLRGYDSLWMPLDSLTKQRYIAEFTQLRRIDPSYSNWLLFSAEIETFLYKVGAQSDMYRIVSALRKMEEWYVGDGWYSDGPIFAFDYYNSFVLHPMYVDCVGIMTDGGKKPYVNNAKSCNFATSISRMQRYGTILERLISPEGTFPVFGRSIAYRTGVLQPLAILAWHGWLPQTLPNGQVRAAMTSVIKNMFYGNQNFTEKGFLRIGFNGHQPEMSDGYIDTGSLYMASLAFLPLGLPVNNIFWTEASQPWTSKKAWNGIDVPRDHAMHAH